MPLLRDRVAIALKRVCSDKDRKETKTKKMRFCDEGCTWTAHDKLLLIHGLRLFGINKVDEIRENLLPQYSSQELKIFMDQYKKNPEDAGIDKKKNDHKIKFLKKWKGVFQKLMTGLPDYSSCIVQAFEDFLESFISTNDLLLKESHDQSEHPDWLALYDYILCLLANESTLPHLGTIESRVMLHLLDDMKASLTGTNLKDQHNFIQSFSNSTLLFSSSSSSSAAAATSSSSSAVAATATSSTAAVETSSTVAAPATSSSSAPATSSSAAAAATTSSSSSAAAAISFSSSQQPTEENTNGTYSETIPASVVIIIKSHSSVEKNIGESRNNSNSYKNNNNNNSKKIKTPGKPKSVNFCLNPLEIPQNLLYPNLSQ